MPVQHTYGTDGATGGGFASLNGLQALFREERVDQRPDWSWQRRSAKTQRDRSAWVSLWSFGCKVAGQSADNGETAVVQRLNHGFEPFSCDGEGTQTKRFIRGITKNSGGTPISDVTVQAFVTADGRYVGQDVSRDDGTYTCGVETVAGTQHYLVAYKAGAPDIAGATVNTLTSTNVDGS